jgi:hypothetical protein
MPDAGPKSGVTYGRAENAMIYHDIREVEFLAPQLVLTLRMPADARAVDPDALAVDVHDLIRALSDYEETIGGLGLYLKDKQFDSSAIILTLAPVLAQQARERVDSVASLVAELSRNHHRNGTASGSLAEAFEKTLSSPTERCRIGLARRPWEIEARITMPA